MKNNNSMLIFGDVITPEGIIFNGFVGIKEGKIYYIGKKKDQLEYENFFDFKNHFISPGFIDIHIHGAYGKDFIDGTKEAINTITNFTSQTGVTGILPTILTAPIEVMTNAIKSIEDIMETEEYIGSKILGINLEGPFLNVKYKGAQREDCILKPNLETLKKLISKHTKIMTLAPEIDGNLEIIQYLNKNNIKISVGHSDATTEELIKAISLGLSHVTHLFNGMRPLHHREPGIIGLALINDEISVELIADGFHLSPYILNLVYKIKPKDKIILITDSMMATGLSDGKYLLAGQEVVVENGKATLASGTLAGSTLTLNRAVKNMVEKVGVKIEDAVYMASYSPALLLGLQNKKGSIELGKDADITVFDRNFQVKMTIVEGKIVYLNRS